MPRHLISNVLGLVGAVIGGTVGFYTFGWLIGQGYYGLMIPGALLGLGCSLGAKHHSTIRGILCGLGALGLSLYTEWSFRPWLADESLRYFLGHLNNLSSVTLLMIGIGAVIAFWVGRDAGLPGLSMRGPDARSSVEHEPRKTE